MVMGRRFRAALQHKIISNLPLIKSTHKKKKKKTRKERESEQGRGGREKEKDRERGWGGGEGKHNSGFMASITDISHLV